jgi:hypothetical protein
LWDAARTLQICCRRRRFDLQTPEDVRDYWRSST